MWREGSVGLGVVLGLLGAGFLAWGFGIGYFDGVLIAVGLRLVAPTSRW